MTDNTIANNNMTADAAPNDTSPDEMSPRKARDNTRLRAVALRHSAAILAAFTLWGTADFWAASSGMLLADVVAGFNAIFAATAVAYLCHEWGHFAGARFAGAVSPVMKKPESFFMFTFYEQKNSSRQFLSMSVGGPAANWLLVIMMLVLLPFETASQALFFATVVAVAVNVSVFEIPVMNRVMYGAEPAATIKERQLQSGRQPRYAGFAAGILVWLLMV